MCPKCQYKMVKLHCTHDPFYFWCPRCGTLWNVTGWGEATKTEHESPLLVKQCENLKRDYPVECRNVGITESIGG